MDGMGGTSYYIGHRAGDGGTAGSGGTIKVSSNANVYAYNGNLYTDGTDYLDGLNQCPIYLQYGVSPTRYEVASYATHAITPSTKYGCTNGITLSVTSSLKTGITKSGYVNSAYESVSSEYKTVTKNSLLSNVDMSTQGVGSGAGYIEVSNGTYTVYDSMN